jgi:hypothetical protein
MNLVRTFSSALGLAAALFAASCSSTEGSPGDSTSGASGKRLEALDEGSGSQASGNWEDGAAVRGDVSVSWKNLDPRNPLAAHSLVNESSEIGRKLRGGKATSSEIRVIGDLEMGRLLAELKKIGFFDHATDNLSLANVPEVPGRRGVVVVTQDGRSKGLMLTTNLGTGPIPKTYVESKRVVLAVHSQVQGFDVRVGTGAADEGVLSVPPPRFKRP